ncbi:MAG TPA: CHAT domain-containing protein, partial [Thermoanaerobaculia bacterium]|nr:CHAT domain-containing protein [Thermoanaerobaculia bacterium]
MIRISSGPAGGYTVQIQSPAGEGHGVFSIPASLAGRSSRPPRRILPGDRNLGLQVSGDPSRRGSDLSFRQVGMELFRTLFVDEVLGLFRASLAGLPSEEHGLRIRLELNPREPGLAPLHDLPWELLCRPETEDFLGLSRHTPIVRFLDAHRERRPAIPLPPRLRILAVAESPADAPPLEVERELHDLEAAWCGLDSRVEILRPEGRGREALHRAFLASTIHVLHFMGHGVFEEWTGEGALLFEGEDGAAFPVSGRGLAQELKGFRSLRFVVLNACHTAQAVGERGSNPFAGVATALVMEGVPAVVAMRRPISDAAALAFGRTLYERLAAGEPVDTAVAEARLAIHRLDETSDEWSTPVLFLRSPDGRLFAPRAPRRWIGGAALVLLLILLVLFSAERMRDRRAAEALRLHHKGVELLHQEKDEAARQAFDAVLVLDAENAAAHSSLSLLDSRAGRYEAALGHARAAASAQPDEAVYHYNLGNLLALLRRDEQALESLHRAVELDAGHAPAFNELGNVYLRLDRPAEAEEALLAGLRADPRLAPLHKNFARAALARGRIDD